MLHTTYGCTSSITNVTSTLTNSVTSCTNAVFYTTDSRTGSLSDILSTLTNSVTNVTNTSTDSMASTRNSFTDVRNRIPTPCDLAHVAASVTQLPLVVYGTNKLSLAVANISELAVSNLLNVTFYHLHTVGKFLVSVG